MKKRKRKGKKSYHRYMRGFHTELYETNLRAQDTTPIRPQQETTIMYIANLDRWDDKNNKLLLFYCN